MPSLKSQLTRVAHHQWFNCRAGDNRFSNLCFCVFYRKMRKLYVDLRRWFETFFAAAFGLAGLKVLTLEV
jgi:hypothetical protein